MNRTFRTTLTALAALSLGAASAMAQPQQQQQQAMDVSDEKLEQFVEAVTEVQSVQQEYASEIQSTQEAAEAQALRQEAQEKMGRGRCRPVRDGIQPDLSAVAVRPGTVESAGGPAEQLNCRSALRSRKNAPVPGAFFCLAAAAWWIVPI